MFVSLKFKLELKKEDKEKLIKLSLASSEGSPPLLLQGSVGQGEEEERVKKDPLILSRYVVRHRGGSDRFWLYHRL